MTSWIERSLERLDWLEGERDRLGADASSSAAATIAEYDTEIAALYEVLESAVDQEDDAAPRPVADEYTLTFIEHVGWTTLRDLAPLAAPPPIATPNAIPIPIPLPLPLPRPVPLPSAAALAPNALELDIIVDEPWEGGSLGWKWIVPAAAAVLLFVGLGTWLGLRPSEAIASTPIADATPQSIDAAAIPDDTQEPKAARGIAADRTPEVERAPASPPTAATPTRAKRPAAPKRERSANTHAIELGNSREPLAGLR